MKKSEILINIAIPIIVYGFLYLSISFSNLEFDVTNWKSFYRAILVFWGSLICAGFYIIKRLN